MATDIQAECYAGKQTAINHALFRELGLTTISICSAPRAGKTTILERTLPFLKDEFQVAVLETDLQPPLDARRIRSAGAPVWQIITGMDRRADASMVAEALRQFPVAGTQVLFIERLIDPDESCLEDWGEELRVIVYRIPPDCSRPANISNLLQTADAILLNTMDCPPGKGIDEKTVAEVTNHNAAVFGLHRPAQDNLTAWVGWLRQRIRQLRSGPAHAAEVSH